MIFDIEKNRQDFLAHHNDRMAEVNEAIRNLNTAMLSDDPDRDETRSKLTATNEALEELLGSL